MPAPRTLRSPFCSTNLPLPTPPWKAASRCLGLAGQDPPTEGSVTEDLTRFLVKTSPLYAAMCPQPVITTSQSQPKPFSSQHSPRLLRSGSCSGVPSFFRKAALRNQGFLSLFIESTQISPRHAGQGEGERCPLLLPKPVAGPCREASPRLSLFTSGCDIWVPAGNFHQAPLLKHSC